MLTIRLQRTGKRNQADFRIVLAEKTDPVKKKFQEVLGSYNPRKKAFQAKEERIKYWIAQHVQLSPTIHNLFVDKGLVTGAKVKAFSIPKKKAEEAVASTTLSSAAADDTPPQTGGETTTATEAPVQEAPSAPSEPAQESTPAASDSAEATSDKPAAENAEKSA